MAGRQSIRRRRPLQWGIRIAIAASASWIGYQAICQSWALAISRDLLERAHALAPGNGRIASRLSEDLSGPEASPESRARSEELAQSALLRDPTAVEAVATLGVNALLRRENARGNRLFRYAETLSRREVRTQLWMIESAVAREDVPGALKQYDIALRTKPRLSDVLYPVLASAVSDPTIQAALIQTLAHRPNWTASFLEFLVSKGPDPLAAATLLRSLQRKGLPVSNGVKTASVNALLSAGYVEAAWSYYTFVRGGGDRRASRDPDFTLTSDNPAPFDWIPGNDPAISASIQRGTERGVFSFSAPASVGGELLRQMQMLPPGRYILEGHSNNLAQPADSRPYWTLNCGNGQELGRIALPNSDTARGQFSGAFVVPDDCPVQTLRLMARPSNEIMGLSGELDRALLRPAS